MSDKVEYEFPKMFKCPDCGGTMTHTPSCLRVTGEDGLVDAGSPEMDKFERLINPKSAADWGLSVNLMTLTEEQAARILSLESRLKEAEERAKANQEDAERYEKIKELLLGADFEWGDEKETVLIFRWLAGVPISANLDSMLDAIAARGDHDAQLEDEAVSRISDQQKMLEGEHDARVAAEALAKANQEDAERYRWLRESRHIGIWSSWLLPNDLDAETAEQLDVAIDAARGAKP